MRTGADDPSTTCPAALTANEGSESGCTRNGHLLR